MCIRDRIHLAFSLKGTAGVCFLRKDIEDEWTLARDLPSKGRLPDWREFSESLSEKCETLSLSANVQTEALPDGKLFGVLAPIWSRSSQPEIMLVAMASQKAAVLATSDMQKITSALGLWINNNNAADADWQVHALAAVIELVAKVEKQTNLKAAAEETANLLANRLGCNAVAVGLQKNQRMRLCLLYTSPSPRDATLSRMPSSA